MPNIKFEDLTEDNVDRIVGAGIELMAAITDAFGSEEGIATWEAFSDTIGNDFKHAIFLSMLTGRTSGVIQINSAGSARSSGNFVQYIKTLRSLTGWGLKEAKDFADETEVRSKTIKLPAGTKRIDAIRQLRSIGVNVL